MTTATYRCRHKRFGVQCVNLVDVPTGTDPRSVKCKGEHKYKVEKEVTPAKQTKLPWEQKDDGHFVKNE